jgi:ABC-2 type transport system permease protein
MISTRTAERKALGNKNPYTFLVDWAVFKNAFLSQTTYRVNTLFSIISGLITVYIEVEIWRALYGGRSTVGTPEVVVPFASLVNYVFISMFISVTVFNSLISKLNQRVRNGQIALDLIRPIRFVRLLFDEVVGENFYKMVFQFGPIGIFGMIFFRDVIVQPHYVFYTIVSFLNAFCLYFLMTFCLGLLSFWFTEVWQLAFILDGFMKLFSGSWVPLWFFPEALRQWVGYLPFHLVFYDPISIVLNLVDAERCLAIVLTQLGWIGVLIAAAYSIWKAGVSKLSIQGG